MSELQEWQAAVTEVVSEWEKSPDRAMFSYLMVQGLIPHVDSAAVLKALAEAKSAVAFSVSS